MRISLGVQLGHGGGGAIISSVVPPSMTALANTDTPADGYVVGSYESTEGSIVSATPSYYVNGFEELGTYDLQDGDEVFVRVLVTDSASNTRTFPTNKVRVPLPLVAFGAESASEIESPIVGVSVPAPTGVESTAETGTPVAVVTMAIAQAIESASEVGSPSASDGSDTIAPTMTNVNFDEGTSTFTATLSEAATLHFLVDSTEPTTTNAIINGTGIYKTTVSVGAGGSSEPIEFSSVQAGTHWLGVIPEDAAGNSDFAQAHVEEYVFTGPYVATGSESVAETGSPIIYISEVTATGVESTSQVGTTSTVSGAWSYSGSIVTTLPTDEGWEFTGSVIDTIPAAA